MACNVVRYRLSDKIAWGVVKEDKIIPVPGEYTSLRDFLANGAAAARELKEGKCIPIKDVKILSPVTSPCRIVCQGVNYHAHRSETGITEKPGFNLLFSKESSSLTGPSGKVIRPKNVRLLDYELELGLVIGSKIEKAENIHESNISEYVAAIVMCNDISARDIQIPQGQWYKGKSYRTFCPAGPHLCLLDVTDFKYLANLELKLWVNNRLRQDANTKDLIFKPAESLKEISEIMDLEPGDIIMTGTPGGVALKAPPKALQKIAGLFLSDAATMKLFIKKQLKNNDYLQPEDIIESTIKSADGSIDLGRQRLNVTG